MKKQLFSILSLLLMAAGGAVAQNENTASVTQLTKNAQGNWVLDAMPGYNGVLEVTFFERFKLDSIPMTWTITVNGADSTSAVTPYEEGATTGWLMVQEGADVRLTPPTVVKPTVKNVTLTEVPDARALSEATAEDVGKVIGLDGHIYDNAAAATAAGTAASAIIAYVGTAGSVDESSTTYKGLAIALTDANSGGTCPWCSEIGNTCVSQTDAIATAITYTNGIASTNTLTSDGHTHAAATAASSYGTALPSSGTSAWFLPSMGQWNLIVQGLATKQAGSTVSTNLTTSASNTYKSSNLNSVITDAGGTGFQSGGYWSSTEHTSGNAWRMIFSLGRAYNNSKTANNYVRAVFAF